MPMFVEDPANFSKSRLKSDLVAHNVKLPPAKSKKEVYVELHMQHIDQKKTVEFSSDEEVEEDEEDDMEGEDGENPGDAEMPDPSALTDDDLKAALLKHGVKAGPIVASTRFLYEKKLRKLLQSDGHHGQLNGAKNGMMYSDSEEEENGEDNDAESSAEEENKETVEESDQAEEESSQHIPTSKPSPVRNSGNVLKSSERSPPPCSQNLVGISRGVQAGSQSVAVNGYSSSSSSSSSSQTFSITEMLKEMEGQRSLSTSANSERAFNGGNVQDHWSQSNRLDMPSVVNRTMKNQSLYYTPKAFPQEWGMQEPVKDDFKHLFPAEITPSGIYATRRRPIKGAAGRPIQYMYPDTPVSPMTLQRRDVERRLVPVHIQIVVFVIVTCMLYLIYVSVEDNRFSPSVSLLDNLNPGSNSEEALLHKTEAQDTPALSEWE
ncbi:lamina-associated polypeptide 2, isoforms beta/gamma-like isoform X2 [Solea solea]|uniref:lamina-associated polypeptide 2, isoforms beta/gamma-like isoform X2 n=1 Tax=Solea solea TaxID=90069 RepID=UPI00272D5014|nr:lamina-associated polypeptide 2, isoforms beta/gamma-like isoform X2 [Solea solea]